MSLQTQINELKSEIKNKKKEKKILKKQLAELLYLQERQITSLEKSIKQWEIVYKLVKFGECDDFIVAKRRALEIIAPNKVPPFRLCFLCKDFAYEYDGNTCIKCIRCPMFGRWPAKTILGIDRKPKKRCNEPGSLYMYLEGASPLKENDLKYIQQIIDIMKTRLKELKDEKETD